MTPFNVTLDCNGTPIVIFDKHCKQGEAYNIIFEKYQGEKSSELVGKASWIPGPGEFILKRKGFEPGDKWYFEFQNDGQYTMNLQCRCPENLTSNDPHPPEQCKVTYRIDEFNS